MSNVFDCTQEKMMITVVLNQIERGISNLSYKLKDYCKCILCLFLSIFLVLLGR